MNQIKNAIWAIQYVRTNHTKQLVQNAHRHPFNMLTPHPTCPHSTTNYHTPKRYNTPPTSTEHHHTPYHIQPRTHQNPQLNTNIPSFFRTLCLSRTLVRLKRDRCGCKSGSKLVPCEHYPNSIQVV